MRKNERTTRKSELLAIASPLITLSSFDLSEEDPDNPSLSAEFSPPFGR